jgi:hypothetical protein
MWFEIRCWILPIPRTVLLWWSNKYTQAQATGPSGPVVSLTSHGKRIRSVYLAIESVARGTVLPSRIILWIDEKDRFENLPVEIQRLMERGLEVKLCENYGPHTKYYPYLAGEEDFCVPLVIADDDQLYPRNWLAKLVEAYREFPTVVNCHWAVEARLSGSISKYQGWKRCGRVKPSFGQIALGTSGVIYGPEFLRILKAKGNAFKRCCPRADDLWLHVQALRSGYKIRQIHPRRLYCLQIIGSQSIALAMENDAGGNDRQIAATYTDPDIQIMLKG